MSRTEILSQLAEIFEDVVDVPAAEVTEEKLLADDLDVDSLSMVEVVVVIEEKLGVKLPEDTVPELRTVGDVVAYIESALVAA